MEEQQKEEKGFYSRALKAFSNLIGGKIGMAWQHCLWSIGQRACLTWELCGLEESIGETAWEIRQIQGGERLEIIG
jgi:hypothetical protein